MFFVLLMILVIGLVAAWVLTWDALDGGNGLPAPSHLADKIRGLGAWGVLASIGLMIVHSFVPFPAEILGFANGLVFGVFWGSAVTWIGAMLGAYLAFGLSRLLGRPFVDRMLSAHASGAVERWSHDEGGWTLLICRLIPIIAFNLINYAAGLTRIGWWTFTWATGIGILPITILMAALGSQMEERSWWLAVLVLILLAAAAIGLRHVMAAQRGPRNRSGKEA